MYLKRWDVEDAGFACIVRNHPQLKPWFRQHQIISLQEEEDFIRKSMLESYYGFIVKEYIKEKESRSWFDIGICSLNHINHIHKTAEFGIAILLEFQGKGYTKEAMRILIEEIGFKQLGLRKIYSDVFEGNPALGFFKHLGFVEEGILKKHYWKDGRWIDSTIIAKFAP